MDLSDLKIYLLLVKEKLFLQCQEILYHRTSSSILQDLRDQEDHLQITLLGLQDEITGQQGGAAEKLERHAVKNKMVQSLHCKREKNNWKLYKTSGICKGCPGEPGLCVPECFEEFHTTLDFTH